MRRPAPPGGAKPPETVELGDGRRVDVGALARELCARYYAAHPDDLVRYGPAGQAWCDHDSRYLLAWAIEDARAAMVDCVEQTRWLGRVLAARAFPLERLARHVEMTADVLEESGLGDVGARAAGRMREAAASVRRDGLARDADAGPPDDPGPRPAGPGPDPM